MTLYHIATTLLFGAALAASVGTIICMIDAYLPRILDALFADTSAQDFDQ